MFIWKRQETRACYKIPKFFNRKQVTPKMGIAKRAIKKLKTYSFEDGCRAIVFFLLNLFRKWIQLLRRLKFYLHTRCWVDNILGSIYISSISNNVKVGKHASFYPATVIELGENASLVIGKNFTFSYGAIIACHFSVKMGDFVMIGEYTSIRDSTHNSVVSKIPYCMQADTSEEIVIGDNVWIGRGCVVLPGSIIENGVIVGAHSVVKGLLKANCMYAGAPLKLIREMSESAVAPL